MLTRWRRVRHKAWPLCNWQRSIKQTRFSDADTATGGRKVGWAFCRSIRHVMVCWILPRFIQLLKSPVAARVRRRGHRCFEEGWLKFLYQMRFIILDMFFKMWYQTGLAPLNYFKVRFSLKSWTPRHGNSGSLGFIGSNLTTRLHKRPSKKMRREGAGRVLIDVPESFSPEYLDDFHWISMNGSLLITVRFYPKNSSNPVMEDLQWEFRKGDRGGAWLGAESCKLALPWCTRWDWIYP